MQCWNGKFWTEVSGWAYGPDYKTLVDVDMNNDCSGMKTQIRAHFTTESKGTGLGLYIARELCAANRAALEYVDDMRGAHFRIVCRAAAAA